MGRKYSGRRPEDQPMYLKPNQLDYEKRSLLVTSVSTTFKHTVNTIIEEHEEDNGWIWDGGSATLSVTDSVAMIYDLGGAT